MRAVRIWAVWIWIVAVGVLGAVAFGQEVNVMQLYNEAHTFYERHNYKDAIRTYQMAVSAAQDQWGEENPNTLALMNNLAFIIYAQGDLAGARKIYEHVLEVRRRVLGEEHPDTLKSMNNLASTIKAQGDLAGARKIYEHVLEVSRRVLGEEHPDTLKSMNNLAGTIKAQGDLAGARKIYEHVLEVSRRVLGEEHPDTLRSINNLAGTMYAQGDLAAARKIHQELLDQKNQSASDRSVTLGNIATIHHETGDFETADVYFEKALDAIENLTSTSSVADNSQGRFRSESSSTYRMAMENAFALKQPSKSFEIAERYRTQNLRLLAFDNDKALSVTIPEALLQKRQANANAYDNAFRQLDQLSSAAEPNKEEIAVVLERIRKLERERELIDAEINTIVYGVERPTLPKPMTVEEIRHTLAPGTLLVSYIFNYEGDTLVIFLISRKKGLEVHREKVDYRGLPLQIRQFNRQVHEGQVAEPYEELSSWLYDRLLEPISGPINQAERVVILPDLTLHYLPFSAILRPNGQYVAEWKPIHVAPSASIYARMQQNRPVNENVYSLVAFGDPDYPLASDQRAANVPSIVRSAEKRGIFDGLTKLPYTEHEVRGIQKLFPEDKIRVHLYDNAREENVKADIAKGRIVHFATHGVSFNGSPDDSFLALTIPKDESAADNGIFQAWELRHHPINADLVVLSACQTALGEHVAGEGLLSLSRAFQKAGARTVVASLWSVADASTSELMIRFYTHLQNGHTKDVALQKAQIDLIRSSETKIKTIDEDGNPVERDFSAPFHWAAFQVYGDWK